LQVFLCAQSAGASASTG